MSTPYKPEFVEAEAQKHWEEARSFAINGMLAPLDPPQVFCIGNDVWRRCEGNVDRLDIEMEVGECMSKRGGVVDPMFHVRGYPKFVCDGFKFSFDRSLQR